MLADLILNALGDIAAKRYRAFRRMLWLVLLACIGLIAYGCLAGPA